MALLIREADVDRLVAMPEVIEALFDAERALGEGHARHNPRERVRLPTGMLHLLSAAYGGYVGYKAYTAFGRGPVRFKVFLYSGQTGVLEAIVEGTRLGQLRTGAATGVAARLMAKPEAATVGIIGAGLQAAGQLEALACVRKLRSVRAFSRTPEKLRAFCDRMSKQLGIEVTPAESNRAAIEGADIAVTATTSREPVLEGAWLAPGTFVAAVGANLLIRREIDAQVIAKSARIVVDSIAQARRESGALMAATESGHLGWQRVDELRHVVAGRVPVNPAETNLFHSLGSSLWDLASAKVALERARAAGAGETLPLD